MRSFFFCYYHLYPFIVPSYDVKSVFIGWLSLLVILDFVYSDETIVIWAGSKYQRPKRLFSHKKHSSCKRGKEEYEINCRIHWIKGKIFYLTQEENIGEWLILTFSLPIPLLCFTLKVNRKRSDRWSLREKNVLTNEVFMGKNSEFLRKTFDQ